ncbi:hypothetical protein IPJ72_05800 [Candidatus Peregrinibacteria bacterium]|nr:MAG: hypothetical protein IPJ72_05800 [Candidatus Peregrinibacteria bacterium]
MEYGRDFDFSRPFFDQFADLLRVVPHSALAILGDNENSDYTNDNYKSKNCYLIFDGEQAESCYHGETFVNIKNSLDFLFLNDSEQCYQCTVCHNCYNLKYSQFSQNCSDSWFLKDCIGVRNSFGCINLRNKEYYIFNEPHTKESYEAFIQAFKSSSHAQVLAMQKKVNDFFATQPLRAIRGIQNQNVVGDNLNNCKNAYECYDGYDLQDCRYCTDCLMGAKDCLDVHVWGDGMENCYNSLLVGASIRNIMSSIYVIKGCSDVAYSLWCLQNSQDLLGCVSLRHKQYCILNKQYSKEDYFDLRAKIVEHMKKTGEWGQFFPIQKSFFGYNETIANEYYPLTKNEALKQGWTWSDYEVSVQAERVIPASRLPDDINDIPNDILNWAIECEATGKPFKVIAQELKFYRDHHLPIPRRHPDVRHADRLALKNPYHLVEINCHNCQKEVQTSHPNPKEKVIFCDDCYYKLVN